MEKKKRRTSAAVKNKYAEKTYDRVIVVVPKGRKATLEARAKAVDAGSLNAYICGLVRADLGLSVEEWKGLQPQPVDVEASDVEPMEAVDALDRAEAVPVEPVEAAAEAVDRAQVEAVQPVEEAAAADGLAEVEEAEAVPVVEPVEDAAQPFELFTLCVPYGRAETLRREADRKQVSELVRDAVECYLPDDGYLPHEISFVDHFKQARAAVEAACANDKAKSNREAGDFVTLYFENGSLEIIEELAKKRGCSVNHIINLALAKYLELPFRVWTFEEKPKPKKKREAMPWDENEF